MRTFAEKNKIAKVPSSNLVASYFANGGVFSTEMIQFYIRHGFIVDAITHIIEYEGHEVFNDFAQKLCDKRRAGDLNPLYMCIATNAKATGNMVYGK